MLEEIPVEDQYVFTSMRYDGNSMKPGLTKRSSSMNGKMNNPVCTNCPDASTSAYLMKYHYDRLISAADHLGWFDMQKSLKGPVELFNRIEKAVNEHKKKTGNRCPFKVSLRYFCPKFLTLPLMPIRHENDKRYQEYMRHIVATRLLHCFTRLRLDQSIQRDAFRSRSCTSYQAAQTCSALVSSHIRPASAPIF